MDKDEAFSLRTHIPKTIRKVTFTIIVLLFIFVVAGIAYVFITDHFSTKILPAISTNNAAQSSPLPKPVAPGSNSPEGVAVQTVISPVSVGSNSSITVNTNAGSVCTITVTYNGIQSTDSGLSSKIADAYGNVTWTWTVETGVPVGSWPIKVTCTYHNRSAVVLSTVQVTK